MGQIASDAVAIRVGKIRTLPYLQGNSHLAATLPAAGSLDRLIARSRISSVGHFIQICLILYQSNVTFAIVL